MKAAWSTVLGLAVVVAFSAALLADDKGKEVKLTGTMVCGKCTLKVCDKCTNVLQVKEGGKEVNYFIADKGNKESYHKAICPAGKSQEATVTGVVSEKDGKKWIKPSKVDVK
jgi:hypothetical protein